jgi:hypothetical protein
MTKTPDEFYGIFKVLKIAAALWINLKKSWQFGLIKWKASAGNVEVQDWRARSRGSIPAGYCWGPDLQLPAEVHHLGSSEVAFVWMETTQHDAFKGSTYKSILANATVGSTQESKAPLL